MSTFRFADPWWLLAAIPFLLLTILAIRRERRAALTFSSVSLLKELPVSLPQRLKRAIPWLRFVGILLVVVALARPQRGLSEHRIRSDGIAIMVCLDRSGSMEALDFQWNGERVDRLTAVKNVLHNFVAGDDRLAGRPDDLIGLTVFGGFAETLVPLTLDHAMLLEVLKTVQVPQPVIDDRIAIRNRKYFEEERSTAIGDAIVLGVDRLRDSKAKSRVMVLLSDGENTAGMVEPSQAVATAKQFGIKIYTIGVGSTGRAPFPARDQFGRRIFVAQEVTLDEATLKMIAHETSGQYFHAENTAALQEVYEAIDQLEKSTIEGTTFTEYRELFQWWLLPGIAIVLLDIGFRCTRFRGIP